ncbi:MAG: hypothetical protein JSR82_23140 [Verrucomicrobia bacterium]|nr:hypothetical protein [Verrucomicrobiota bacterium]
MSADWNDFDLPFGLIVPPSPQVLWPHEVWDRWVLDRHAELVMAGLLRPEHNPLPRNFEALDLTGFELPSARSTP